MGTDHLITLPGGVQLSYREVGPTTGRPVLYLHGTPSSRMEAGGTLSDEAARFGLRVLAPDRPGCGRTPFTRYDVRSYPEHIAGFLDVVDVGEVGILGVSGGGRYACACAARLGSRVSRTALVASTAPSDLDGVRVTWSKGDRQLYALAVRAPWLLRSYLAVMARRIRSDPKRVPELFNDLPAEDEAVLARPDVREILTPPSRRLSTSGTAARTRWSPSPKERPLPAPSSPRRLGCYPRKATSRSASTVSRRSSSRSRDAHQQYPGQR